MVIGHWSLVIGHWSLVIGHWSLVIGHLSFVIGHWSFVIGHWSLVIGHWLRNDDEITVKVGCKWSTLPLSISNYQLAISNGLYNLGTGTARSFDDLVKATFAGLDLQPNIKYIDMPLDIRDKYQYFTEANMKKLKDAGYTDEFYSLEKGIEDYVRNYLIGLKIY